MKHTIYNLMNHFVEIEKTKNIGTIGTSAEIWNWEISIANNKEDVYKGTASERDRKVTLGWMELQSDKPLTEMIEACKRYMNQ